MKNKKARYAIVFVLSACFVGFWLAGVLAVLLFIPKDAGLAGGAMVFMYGLGGMGLTLFGSVWLSAKWTEPQLRKAMRVSLAALGITLMLVAIRVVYLNMA